MSYERIQLRVTYLPESNQIAIGRTGGMDNLLFPCISEPPKLKDGSHYVEALGYVESSAWEVLYQGEKFRTYTDKAGYLLPEKKIYYVQVSRDTLPFKTEKTLPLYWDVQSREWYLPALGYYDPCEQGYRLQAQGHDFIMGDYARVKETLPESARMDAMPNNLGLIDTKEMLESLTKATEEELYSNIGVAMKSESRIVDDGQNVTITSTTVIPSVDPDSERIEFESGAQRSAAVAEYRFDLIHPIFTRGLAKTLAEGAAKYGAYNWELGFPMSDLFNHLEAHIADYKSGDRSEDHLFHMACNIMFLCVEAELRYDQNRRFLRLPGSQLSPEMIEDIKLFQVNRALEKQKQAQELAAKEQLRQEHFEKTSVKLTPKESDKGGESLRSKIFYHNQRQQQLDKMMLQLFKQGVIKVVPDAETDVKEFIEAYFPGYSIERFRERCGYEISRKPGGYYIEDLEWDKTADPGPSDGEDHYPNEFSNRMDELFQSEKLWRQKGICVPLPHFQKTHFHDMTEVEVFEALRKYGIDAKIDDQGRRYFLNYNYSYKDDGCNKEIQQRLDGLMSQKKLIRKPKNCSNFKMFKDEFFEDFETDTLIRSMLSYGFEIKDRDTHDPILVDWEFLIESDSPEASKSRTASRLSDLYNKGLITYTVGKVPTVDFKKFARKYFNQRSFTRLREDLRALDFPIDSQGFICGITETNGGKNVQ